MSSAFMSYDGSDAVRLSELSEYLLGGQATRSAEIQVGQRRGVNGVAGRGDAVADGVHREAEVGSMPGSLLDDEIGGDAGYQDGVDSSLSQPAGKVVTRKSGQFLSIDDSIALGERRHLLNQLRARGVGTECLLGITDCSHQLRVPDQAALTSRHGEAGEDHHHFGGTDRPVEPHCTLDYATARYRRTEHRAKESLWLDHVDLPVESENRGSSRSYVAHHPHLPRSLALAALLVPATIAAHSSLRLVAGPCSFAISTS